jgi:hypothetical protein
MSSGHTSDAINNGAVKPPRLRRVLAGLMTLVIMAASFTLALREPAMALSGGALSAYAVSTQFISVRIMPADSAAALATHRQERPTPCQKSVLPGTVNACPLANFNFNGIAVTAAGITPATSVTAAPWHFSNSSLPPQCLGFSPYRPPCVTA